MNMGSRNIAQLASHEPRIQAAVVAAPLEHDAEVRGYLETLVALGLYIKGVRRFISHAKNGPREH